MSQFGLNLHALVRGAIEVVNPDDDAVLYVSTGATWLDGISTPGFAAANVRAQVQATPHESLHYLNGLQYTGGLSIVYAYGDLSAIDRPNGQGGDLLNFRGEWWAVQHVLEWWGDWCSVSVTKQLNAGSLDALLAALANGAVVGVTP